jgi:hypothetical protein
MGQQAGTYARSFRCEGNYSRSPERVVVLTQSASPTCDLYLRHRLAGSRLPVAYWTLGAPCPAPLDGSFLIIVRYVNRRAMKEIEEAASGLAGVAWLLDDDIGVAWRDRDLPLEYRIVMAHFWLRYARRIARVTSELWLSSDVLAECFSGAGPVERIDPHPEPFPLPGMREEGRGRPLRIFYHGQKTHRGERHWLYPIIAAIHDRHEDTYFEIVGRRDVSKVYRDLPRVEVRPPLSWPDYLERSRSVRFDIGLAPLLPTPFNQARSWVKYLDIARFGAVGIYADTAPYSHVVRNGENGLLCAPENAEAWTDALAMLVEDHDLRHRLKAGVDWPARLSVPSSLRRLMDEKSGSGNQHVS